MTHMRKSEMAVAVADDVLKQLRRRTRGYIPSSGTYISAPHCDFYGMEGDLKEHLPEIEGGNCYVCAIGAAILSKARLFDKVPARELDGRLASQENYHRLLRDVFPESQLGLIESAFEGTDMSLRGNGGKAIKAAIAFGEKYEEDKDRLKGIMQNIVANGGVFKPTT